MDGRRGACTRPKEATMHLSKVDPRFGQEDARPHPDEDLKGVQVGLESQQSMKIGASLDSQIEGALVQVLCKNWDVFTWSPADMLGIDPNFLCHCLSISPGVRPVGQKKRRLGEEKRRAIKVETARLLHASWLSNVVMVRKLFVTHDRCLRGYVLEIKLTPPQSSLEGLCTGQPKRQARTCSYANIYYTTWDPLARAESNRCTRRRSLKH
ncbi:hypothetical protein CR513_28932, partial [Mucuna pruriens]